MKITDKIELTDEQRAKLEKKETRNQVIETAIAVAATITGVLVARRFQKQLDKELDQMKEDRLKQDEESNETN